MKNILLLTCLWISLFSNAKAVVNVKDYPLAYQTALSWQKSWDQNKASESRQFVSKGMLDVLSFADIQKALSERRANLGVLKNRKLKETISHGQIYSFPDAEYVAFIFTSNYENKKNVNELIRVIKEGDNWLIFSDLLLEKGQKAVGD